LFEKDYIARDEVDRREQDLLDQRARLQSFERERIALERERSSSRSELSSLGFRQQALLSQLDRGLSGLSQERTESEGKRGIEILAPEDGVATAVTGTLGSITDGNKPLVSIVPKNASLVAQIYAPSRAVGFVEPGDKVMLRFQAYPYQKFGHQAGRVVSVSKTALPPGEITNFAGTPQGGQGQSEPIYRITVALSKQTVKAYGKSHDLQAGMLLEADVLQDKRRLYEWVLEPLYSLTGKI
jgi:membrane fusion protein